MGVGNFLGFTVNNVKVTGLDYTVSANNYAGGAIGEAVGGDVQNVTLKQLKSVTAKNRVGGFYRLCRSRRFSWWKWLKL